jgi:hypothetical protein
MEHRLILTAATALIAVLALLLWRRTRDLSPAVMSAALYYWSLYGAWGLLEDKSGGYSGKKYHYLEARLFPVELDGAYAWTLALYAAFVVAAQATALVLAGPRPRAAFQRRRIAHGRILALSGAACAAAVLLTQNHLSTAWALQQSAYVYTRFAGDDWFTLRQVLNRAALVPAALGAGILLAGRENRFFVSTVRTWHVAGYGVLLAVMGAFTFLLGNKNEVLVALLAGGLTYWHAAWRPRRGRALAAGAAGLWFLYSIDVFRGVPLSGLWEAVRSGGPALDQLPGFVRSSNEAYGAHFSLYGVLAHGMQMRFGYGLYSLACSLVPRIFWPGRPPDIYEYYAGSLGALGGQGYSIHHATGWYLSFGTAGVLLGGAVLGLAWSGSLAFWRRCRPGSANAVWLAGVLAPWLLAAGLPPLLRAGIEGYKGVAVDALLLPLAALAWSCRGAAPAGREPGSGQEGQ